MREVPECLKRRYQAVDELVKDLNSGMSHQSRNCRIEPVNPLNDDPGIKLMCKFWNILKEDPECNLQHAVKQRMALNLQNSGIFGRDITCYQMGQDDNDNDPRKCGKGTCPKNTDPNSRASGTSCCQRNEQDKTPSEKEIPLSRPMSPAEPLSQALGNMKEAASMERKCFEKTTELMSVQQQLMEQISQLEDREQNEVRLLKEADAIWTAMENEYKQKLEASKRRQEELLRQQKEVELSANKWRKNKKDLDMQMKHVDKCLQEIKDKFNQKTNDLKCLESEVVDLEKRIEIKTKEVANESKTLEAKRQAHAKRMEKLKGESKKIHTKKTNEEKLKAEKIAKGNGCIKEAREELAKLCRVLLKKKLENEDLRAESKALMDELDLLRTTCDQCGERCKNKEQSLISDIEKCKEDIKKFKLRCSKCHVSTDTIYLRRYCTECPRCQEEMDPCVYGTDKCTELASNECICITVKNKFMNNVFDNMYTVLERQINTRPGKAVAGQVLTCLKNSTNGKLDSATRKILQNFILAAVKQNLNLTIIGGAVKTRCEMEPDTYKELMLCLTKVKVQKPPKVDKGTDSRKEPCARWGGPYECNCPKGPKDCICRRKAPKKISDPEPCGQLEEDKKDIGELSICPHKDQKPCGPTCGNVPETSKEATKLAKEWNPAPCAEKSCTFQTNMRAAQCVLGNDLIEKKTMVTKGHMTIDVPLIDIPSDFGSFSEEQCDCGSGPTVCFCYERLPVKSSHDFKCLRNITVPSETEFKNMFDNQNTALLVTVLGQNGVKADLNAELTKTESGHMAVDVKSMSYIGEIADQIKDYPVSLFKTSSSYKLFVSSNNEKTNAVLNKGSSGEMTVVLKQISKSQKNRTPSLNPRDKLFRVKAKHVEVRHPEITFIRLTPSGNYEFVVDKEFEKQYKDTVNDYLGDNTECYVNLSKTKSGPYVIDFDHNIGCGHNNDALLSKSESGTVKLIVNGPEIKKLNKEYSSIRRSSKALYKELYGSLNEFSGQLLNEQNLLKRKSGVEYISHQNTKLKILDQEDLVGELSINLEEISSGVYSVIFMNEREASFIANLLSSWQSSLLAIKKTSKHELTVYLNRCQDHKKPYGWLKMTPDGQIVITVENIATKGVATDAYPQGCAGMYYEERMVTTTCHDKTDFCTCDISKCVCDELSSEWDSWSFDRTDENIQEIISWSKASSVPKSV